MRGGRRRVDATQAVIVEALRGAGCSVLCIHHVGHGAPDLVVGWGLRVLFLLECKSEGGELTLDERRFIGNWHGPRIEVAWSPEGALAVLYRHIGIDPPGKRAPRVVARLGLVAGTQTGEEV